MRANYAKLKQRYCQKLGEQVLWDDFDDFVPVSRPRPPPSRDAQATRALCSQHASRRVGSP